MHYLLNDQSFYFPSSNDQSYILQRFLDNTEHHLPIIVRISSLSNVHDRTMKNLLAKNIPLLLLSTHQFQSILSEYHNSTDGKHHHTSRHRLTLPQGNLLGKKKTKYRTMKKLSKSLISVAATNLSDENSDDDYFHTRTIVRNFNEKRSVLAPLCRIPLNYHGFFELLNENDQAIEPFHQVSNLLIFEYNTDDHNQQVRTEKWPQAFFLRSTCLAYTKRYIPDDGGKLSGSADSCYGSLSDLDSHKNLLILNDDKQILQPGQKIIILNQCSAYRSQISEQESNPEQFLSQSMTTTTTSWLRSKSRFFFPRKKSQSSHSSLNQSTTMNNSPTKNIYDIPRISQPYLKCQIEQGDIVYISIYETGLFSPLYSPNVRSSSTHLDSETIDISGVFQLKSLLSNFRFPISVRSLNNSITFDNIYSPASSSNPSENSFLSSTKFRLLLPYTEDVVFACPLILPSSFKSQIIILPIPISSDIEIQRCLNMREIFKNRSFHNLIQKCSHLIHQYQTAISYIHFPLILSAPTKQTVTRKQPLFKKRSQSESHIEYHLSDLTRDVYRKSCDVLNHTEQLESDEIDRKTSRQDQVHHRNNLKTIKQNLSNHSDDTEDKEKVSRHSSYYAKLKIDKPRKYSRQEEHDSDDENYRELDHIYDYIRSGDITDDVKKIQAKEQSLNAKYNQINSISKVCGSTILNVPDSTLQSPKKQTSPKCDSPGIVENHQFTYNLDDEPDDDDDDDIPHTYYSASRRNTLDIQPESIKLKPITRMKRLSKH